MIDQQIRAALEAELKEISERYNLHSLNVCWSTVAGSENEHHSNMQHEVSGIAFGCPGGNMHSIAHAIVVADPFWRPMIAYALAQRGLALMEVPKNHVN